MSIGDSLPPLPDERKTRKRQIVVVVIACTVASALIIYAYYSSLPPDNLYKVKDRNIIIRNVESPAPVDERELWRAHSQKELLRLKKENKRLDKQVSRILTSIEALQKRESADELAQKQPMNRITDKVINTPLPQPPHHTKTASPLLPPPPGFNPATSVPPTTKRNRNTSNTMPESQFFVMDIADGEKLSPKDGTEKIRRKTVDNFLPPGTYIKTRLLSGLDAPTGGQAQNNPIPFLVRLKDNGQLPNGFRSRVKHCFVTLAGVGNISDNRVYGGMT